MDSMTPHSIWEGAGGWVVVTPASVLPLEGAEVFLPYSTVLLREL